MKKVILLVIIITLFSCKEKKQTPKEPLKPKAPTENLDWLLGKWQRTNDEEGKKTFENWYKKNDIDYNGIGFTMKEKDTVSKEIMQLFKENDAWHLIVSSTGKGDDTGATAFKLVKKDASSFTFENNEIDFPNTIHYQRKGNTIKATVANSEMSIPFDFVQLVK